jgi:hypothetical protein
MLQSRGVITAEVEGERIQTVGFTYHNIGIYLPTSKTYIIMASRTFMTLCIESILTIDVHVVYIQHLKVKLEKPV